MMRLTKRKLRITGPSVAGGGDDETTKKPRGNAAFRGVVLLCLVAVVLVSTLSRRIPGASPSWWMDEGNHPAPDRGGIRIEEGAELFVRFGQEAPEGLGVSLGPHPIELRLSAACQNPGLWLRLEGAALAGVELVREHPGAWGGSLSFPVGGTYDLVAYWHGCDGAKEPPQRRILLAGVTASSATNSPLAERTDRRFPPSAWIASGAFPAEQSITQAYVWHNPLVPASSATLFKTSEGFLAKESSVREDTGFYRFGELSNYELVCWIGSESASAVHAAFLQLRPHINKHQRPFKFHLYESDSFSEPDATWSEEKKKKFRKCKHLLVSMDRVQDPTSQAEYLRRVETFLNHLLRAFPDETFPIWMFTVMESPAKPTNCLPISLPASSEHPCNTALKELFRNHPIPERVRLLDNTDISFPKLGEDPKEVAMAVALRVFVLVGEKVAEWRSVGQKGQIKGLERNGTIEPNFELVPYTGWALDPTAPRS